MLKIKKIKNKKRKVLVGLSISTFLLLGGNVQAAPADDFVITVKTDNAGSSTDYQFTIPTTGSGYNYNVDCNNDGTDEATAQTGNYTCDYGTGNKGTYTIRIKDNTGAKTGFPRIHFYSGGDEDKILSVNQWGTGKWTSMAGAFYGCSNLNSATAVNNGGGAVPDWATDTPDLSGVTNISYMFYRATNFNQPLNNWDTSNVTNMKYMFFSAINFNQPLNNWNTSSVTNMADMFSSATNFNQPLNSWDTSQVTNMTSMFSDATNFNQPLNNWDTSQVTNMTSMFRSATNFNQPLNSWDTLAVTNMSSMFSSASAFNQPLNNWDTSAVTNMSSMFSSATNFNQPLNTWDTSKVTDMSWMFSSATNFNQPLNTWDTSKVTNMSSMFSSATNFNQPLNSWDTSAVTNMSSMFSSATNFNQPLNSWDTSAVTNMSSMFSSATNFNQPLDNWNVSNVTNMQQMLSSTSMSTSNYDTTLIGWNGPVPLQSNVTLDATAFYCTAETQRQNIMTTYGWNINDKGKNCEPASGVNYTANDFVITINTQLPGPSSDTQFTIPTTGTGYNYNVDCNNDGTDEATGVIGDYTCNYATPGTYKLVIKDNTGLNTGFPRIYFNNTGDREKLVGINQWGTNKWTSMEGAFYGCTNVNDTGGAVSDTPDLSGVTNMSEMFRSATNFNQPLNNWNTSAVTTMVFMFSSATNFNQPLNSWNTSKVTNMSRMFSSATNFNQPLNSWDTSNVINMSSMFSHATNFNQSLNSWDTSKVTSMSSMFSHATNFNQSLNSWDTSKVTNMSWMFYLATNFNQPLNNWNTSAVKDMIWMFSFATNFNQPLNLWNTSQVTNMSHMFTSVTNFNQPLNTWNTSAVTSMSSMFFHATNFNQPLNNWDTSQVTNMTSMFSDATNFNQPLNNWDTSQVTDMTSMFRSATNFNQPIGNWNTSNVTNMSSMFYQASAFNQDIGNWNTSQVTNMYRMFSSATNFNQPLDNWNTSKVTDMAYMFYEASAFNQDLSGLELNAIVDTGSNTGLRNMLDNSGLSIANYDATIIGWNNNTNTPSNLTLGSQNLKYCQSTFDRSNLINNKGWTINGDSQDCPPVNIITKAVTGIGEITATGNGEITNANGVTNIERFIEWGTTSGTYPNECSAGTGGEGNYSCVMTGLIPNTTYYVRAKAVNYGIINYGTEVNFTTITPSASVGSLYKLRGDIKMRGVIRFR